MKRSVSPLSGSTPDAHTKKKRLISVFSALKGVFSGSSPKPVESTKPEGNPFKSTASDEELPNSFVSRKRKMSIHDSIKRSSLTIPRSSVSGPAGRGVLESLYDSVKSQQETNDLDGEFTRLGANPEEQLAREISPSVYVPRTRILPKNPRGDFDYNSGNPGPEENNMQALVLDQDYDSMYDDDRDDSARPPFIHLDPRERYQLLQMKKQIETSEFLQSRLKYMVDPDETTSVIRSDNKVDSSTQTHTKDYLHNSLNFNALRSRLALRNRRQRKAKKGLGVFSGEFYYEPAEPEATSNTDSKFQGVLGLVKKPQFTGKPEQKTEKAFPDAESRQGSMKRRGSVSQRPGLEDALRFGKTRESLDEEYLKKISKTSDVLKIKDQPAESKSVPIGPSSAFKFDIQKDKFNSLLDHANSGDASAVSKAEMSAENVLPPLNLFGSQDKKGSGNLTHEVEKDQDKKRKAPSFGASKPFSFPSKADAPKTPNFGKELTDSAEKPPISFSFGAPSSKPVDLFSGSKRQEEPKKSVFSENAPLPSVAKQAAFSFGKSNDKVESNPPAISFGGSEQKTETKKPTFSFGGSSEKVESKPSTFSFNSNSATADAKPSAFSFGGASKVAENGAPAFSFGGEKKTEAPALTFGKSGTNKDAEETSKASANIVPIQVGGLSSKGNLEKVEKLTTPSVSAFGETINASKDIPKFNFGSTSKSTISSKPEEAEESRAKRKTLGGLPGMDASSQDSSIVGSKGPAQGGLFGNKSFTAPFGASPAPSTSEKQDTANASIEVAKPPGTEAPKFSFGNPATAGSEAPKFSFGQAAKETPSFSFSGQSKAASGSGPESKENATPAFGDTRQPSTNFSFGSGANPVTLGNQTSSSEPTPAPSFPFSNANPAQGASGSSASFNFGQSATADPASIFGASNNAPAPAFNFSVTPKPASSGAPANPPVSFGSTANLAGGFTFSSNAVPSFGASRATTPSNPDAGFGSVNQNAGQTQTPNFGGFNNATAPSSVFGGTSRSVTPNFGGFGQNPQNNSQAPATGMSFPNNAMGGATFNSAPGSFGQVSRESTPPAFGNPMGAVGAPPAGPNFASRKLAQMRPRRRR